MTYPFGYGLSYTKFEYSSLRAEKDGSGLKASLKIKNAGCRDSKEAVTLYLRPDDVSDGAPNVKLVCVGKVFIKAGDTAELTLDIEPDALKYTDEDGNYYFRKGKYTLLAGSCLEKYAAASAHIDL